MTDTGAGNGTSNSTGQGQLTRIAFVDCKVGKKSEENRRANG